MQKTVLLPDVLAEEITYSAPIFASVVVSVRMMKTQNNYETDDEDDGDDM